MTRSAIVSACILLFLACPSRADNSDLGFGLIGTESSDTLRALWQPFLDDMSNSLGINIHSMAFEDYAGAVWALKTNKVQIAWLGNKSAIDAVDRADGEVAFIAAERGGATSYTSQIITRVDSELHSAEDLLNKASTTTFRMGDPNSTSGTVAPSYYLFSAKALDPKSIFKRLDRGSHETNFLAVIHKTADAATINSFDLQRMQDKYPDMFPLVRVIWNSPALPSDPIVWRKNLPATLKTRIRAFLLNYGQPTPDKTPENLEKERQVLYALGRTAFKPSNDRQLIPVRKLELFTLKEHVLSDKHLSPEEKAERAGKIDKSLEAFQAMEEATGK